MGGLTSFVRFTTSTGVGFALLALLVLGGCGGHSLGEPPELHPVTGTVLSAQGLPITDGMIEFRSTTDAQQSARGNVQSEGRFSLETIWGREKLPGAAVGQYEVTYYPAMGPKQTEVPVTLPDHVKVEAKDNDFVIQLGGAGRGASATPR